MVWPRTLRRRRYTRLGRQAIELIRPNASHCSNVAQLFFDLSDNLELSCSVECIAWTSKELKEMACYVPPANIYSLNRTADWVALVNRGAVTNTISTIKNDTSLATLSVETKNGLSLEEETRALELLKEELCWLLPIREWV